MAAEPAVDVAEPSRPADSLRLESLEPLTPREQSVLELLARGCGNREIATTLGLALGTVKNHVSNILSKLGEQSRTRVAVRAAMALSATAANHRG